MRKLHYPTNRAKAATALLEHPKGVSGRELNVQYFMNSGRNEMAAFIRIDGVLLNKVNGGSNNNGTGGRDFLIYSIPNKKQALKVIQILNQERAKCGLEPLTEQETYHYLQHFEG